MVHLVRSRSGLLSIICQVILQHHVAYMSTVCQDGSQCNRGMVCFRNKCQDFHLNTSYVRVTQAADMASHILQLHLEEKWYSVVEIVGEQPPSMFCRAINIRPFESFYLQRKTSVDEEGCVVIKGISCYQSSCIGKIEDQQECSDKYRLSLICNSDYETSAVRVVGNITQGSITGDVEALHDNDRFRICSIEGNGFNLIQRIIDQICRRNNYNKSEIHEVCNDKTRSAAIYFYYTYVYSIHEEECQEVLQAKCIKGGNDSISTKGMQRKQLNCNYITTTNAASLPRNHISYEDIDPEEEKEHVNNNKKRSGTLHVVPVTHIAYGSSILILTLILIVLASKIYRTKSELKKASNSKVGQLTEVAKLENMSFRMTELKTRGTCECDIESFSQGIHKNEKPVSMDEIGSKEAFTHTDDVCVYHNDCISNIPQNNAKSRALYDHISTYENISRCGKDENPYQEIDRKKSKRKK